MKIERSELQFFQLRDNAAFFIGGDGIPLIPESLRPHRLPKQFPLLHLGVRLREE